MISLDSNIVLIALDKRDDLHEKAGVALETYAGEGYCICSPVYAELRAAKNWTVVHEFVETSGIIVHWEMPQIVWNQAGIFSRPYADKRREGRLPRRILADFLIAAHAEHHKFDVMSFDETVYKVVLENVNLITP